MADRCEVSRCFTLRLVSGSVLRFFHSFCLASPKSTFGELGADASFPSVAVEGFLSGAWNSKRGTEKGRPGRLIRKAPRSQPLNLDPGRWSSQARSLPHPAHLCVWLHHHSQGLVNFSRVTAGLEAWLSDFIQLASGDRFYCQHLPHPSPFRRGGR